MGSEVYGALCNERKTIGIELKPSYYRMMVKNIATAKTYGVDPEPTFNFKTQAEEKEELESLDADPEPDTVEQD